MNEQKHAKNSYPKDGVSCNPKSLLGNSIIKIKKYKIE